MLRRDVYQLEASGSAVRFTFERPGLVTGRYKLLYKVLYQATEGYWNPLRRRPGDSNTPKQKMTPTKI